jgi:hypothetical protein
MMIGLSRFETLGRGRAKSLGIRLRRSRAIWKETAEGLLFWPGPLGHDQLAAVSDAEGVPTMAPRTSFAAGESNAELQKREFPDL